MIEPTDKTVLMKCEGCQYEEQLPIEEYKFFEQMEADEPEVHILCPFCLNNMYRADSDIFKK